MGSSAHIVIYPNRGIKGDDVLKRMSDEIKHIEYIANRFDEESEISKINSLNTGERVMVNKDLIDILKISKELTMKTDGAFDPTYMTEIKYGGKPVSGKRERDDWSNLSINEDTMTIAKLGDVLIDLGAIAKGYAADRALKSVEGLIKGGMVEIGGDISTYGEKPDGSPWVIEIPEEFGDFRIVIEGGGGVATSSSRHGNLKEGEFHIVDPKTGKPIVNINQSLVVSSDATMSDAFATSLIVLGKDGIGLINRTDNIEGMIVTNGELYKSDGIDKFLNKEFWIELVRTSALPQSDIEHHSRDSE
jgi:thiamine biosynthesis lipoprotein